jgi:hypothetical protein
LPVVAYGVVRGVQDHIVNLVAAVHRAVDPVVEDRRCAGVAAAVTRDRVTCANHILAHLGTVAEPIVAAYRRVRREYARVEKTDVRSAVLQVLTVCTRKALHTHVLGVVAVRRRSPARAAFTIVYALRARLAGEWAVHARLAGNRCPPHAGIVNARLWPIAVDAVITLNIGLTLDTSIEKFATELAKGAVHVGPRLAQTHDVARFRTIAVLTVAAMRIGVALDTRAGGRVAAAPGLRQAIIGA